MRAALATCVGLGCSAHETVPAPSERDGRDRREMPAEPHAPTPRKPAQGLKQTPSQLPARQLPATAKDAVEAPLRLTASDGTGLRLVSLTARAVVGEPLAFTELHLVFKNPAARRIEGRFTIDLPPDAAISRFAMKIGSRWQEGEVVERQAARVAYEDFLHRKQDPALLENQAGNRFSARVFPILAGEQKEIIISYSQELHDSSKPYRLLLRGLPQLDELDARIVIERSPVRKRSGETSPKVITLHKRNYAPERDLVVASTMVKGVAGIRHQNLVLARVQAAGRQPAQPIEDLTLLFDTSASRGLGFAAQIERLGLLVAQLRRDAATDFPLRVVAFDQDASLMFEGKVSEFGRPQLAAIYARRALGASDISSALRRVAATGVVSSRILVVSDGIATAGEDELGELKAAAVALGEAGARRLDAVIDGGLRDRDALVAMTTAGLAHHGIVVDAALPVAQVSTKLSHATLSAVAVTVPGSEWVWPSTLNGVQPGDEVLVYASLPEDIAMRVVLTGTTTIERQVALAEVSRTLLERAWVGARIDRLTDSRSALPVSDEQSRTRLQDKIVELSVKHRVLSDFTALLVLETEADYARFKIDRNALSDIMIAGPEAVEMSSRKWQQWDASPGQSQIGDQDDVGWTIRRPTGGLEDPIGVADVAAAAFSNTGELPGSPLGGYGRAKGKVHRGEEGRMGRAGGSGRLDTGVARPRENNHPAPAKVPEPAFEVAAKPKDRSRTKAQAPAALTPAQREAQLVLERERAKRAQSPYDGRTYDVMTLLAHSQHAQALELALKWQAEVPGDILALLALGEALEAQGKFRAAARAYGSLIDLFPARADLRRYAGARLEALGAVAMELAADTYAHAVEQRPDHPSSHRKYAYALLRSGAPQAAFEAIVVGAARSYPSDRFSGVGRILGEDVGLIAAAWIRIEPNRRAEIKALVDKAGATVPNEPSTRFVMSWETDANDVDFHIYDGANAHAWYSARRLPSGGELYADVTTGYGPECFAVPGTASAYPYRFEANYYSRGPMGYGMGRLQILQHDGKGELRFDDRPFLIMKDQAFVKLGTLDKPLTRERSSVALQ